MFKKFLRTTRLIGVASILIFGCSSGFNLAQASAPASKGFYSEFGDPDLVKRVKALSAEEQTKCLDQWYDKVGAEIKDSKVLKKKRSEIYTAAYKPYHDWLKINNKPCWNGYITTDPDLKRETDRREKEATDIGDRQFAPYEACRTSQPYNSTKINEKLRDLCRLFNVEPKALMQGAIEGVDLNGWMEESLKSVEKPTKRDEF